jgi:hypothetical protein
MAFTPEPGSLRQSIMVRSMEAVKRVRLAGVTWDPCGMGCQATECTQSSWPTRRASMVTVYRTPPASKPGLGANLLLRKAQAQTNGNYTSHGAHMGKNPMPHASNEAQTCSSAKPKLKPTAVPHHMGPTWVEPYAEVPQRASTPLPSRGLRKDRMLKGPALSAQP